MISDSEPAPLQAPPLDTPPILPNPLNSSPLIPDLIKTAVNFLKDSQVQSASLSKRLAFLEKKGLTAQEIELALLKANDVNYGNINSSRNINTSSNLQKSQSTSYSGLIVTTAVVLGTASLLISNYQTIKSAALKLFTLKSSDEIQRVERDLKKEIQDLKDLIEEKERILQESLNTMSDSK